MRAGDLWVIKNYKIGGSNLSISDKNLTSLEGCPKKIFGYFACGSNNLTSFEYFPIYIKGYCLIDKNQFTSFKDIDRHIRFIGRALYAYDMNITSGFSDLFGIDGLQGIGINNYEIRNIINKYIKQKDLINFQDEMIKAGYESYL